VTGRHATLVAVAVGLTLVPAALGGEILDRAARALATDPVYVDPEATPKLTADQERRLESEISRAGEGPIYVAVLPAKASNETGGDAAAALAELADDLRRPGVYAIVAGGQFRAGATGDSGLDRGEAARLATDAFRAHRNDGLAATLVDFVDRVGAERTDDDGGGPVGGLSPLWLLALAVVGFFTWRRIKRRRAEAEELHEVKEAAREDLVALAEDVGELEDDVERVPAAKRDYLAALEQYDRASRSFDRARTPRQLEPVAQALDEGRYLMTSAKARLEGREPPGRRPPCFFDPRHGPSVRDVLFAPPGADQ
jgi:MYXO-CTERM domain-containing protein